MIDAKFADVRGWCNKGVPAIFLVVVEVVLDPNGTNLSPNPNSSGSTDGFLTTEDTEGTYEINYIKRLPRGTRG